MIIFTLVLCVSWFINWLWGSNAAEQDSKVIQRTNGVSVVCHTFWGYRRYWEGWLHHWRLYGWGADQKISVLIATDRTSDEWRKRYPEVQWVVTNQKEWADRLRDTLRQVTTSHILYMQEDMWLTDTLPQALTVHRPATVLKLQPHNSHTIGISDVHDSRFYIISHQPALWRTQYLADSLARHGPSPFRHEVDFNRYLHAHPKEAEKVERLPVCQYAEVSRRGSLRPIGKILLNQAGLSWHVCSDEVLTRGT